MEQHQGGDDDKGEQPAPSHPDLIWVVEERIEEQRPRINDAVATPGLLRKSRVAGQLRAHPLILHCRLRQELRHEEEKHPLEADEANVAPDLKSVLTVESPALERLSA